MKQIMIGVIGLMFFAGCGAGTSAQLLAFDNIELAADEVTKGVNQYHQSDKEATLKVQDAYVKAVESDVYKIAMSNDETPETAKKLAETVSVKLRQAMMDFEIQSQNREKLYSVTIDNLNYIKQVCTDARAFEIYRADIGAQWKSYLESTSRIKKVGK